MLPDDHKSIRIFVAIYGFNFNENLALFPFRVHFISILLNFRKIERIHQFLHLLFRSIITKAEKNKKQKQKQKKNSRKNILLVDYFI